VDILQTFVNIVGIRERQRFFGSVLMFVIVLSRTSRLCSVFWYNRIRRRVEQSKSIESHRSKNLFDFQPVLCGVNLISSPFGIILLAIYARKLDT
jgi:hypothetical protein